MSQIPCATSVRATTTRPAVGAGTPASTITKHKGIQAHAIQGSENAAAAT